jgi:predicted nucleic-acid-binding Zn-ribbon protein
MDAFNKVFIHQPEYRVIICRRCKYAVNPAQIKGHITANHCSVSKQQR